jgi:hypothetical protein
MQFMTLDRKHYFGGVVYPFPNRVAAIGIGFVQYGVNKIERRDEFGILEGEFSDLENTIAMWYGSGTTGKSYWGVAAKYHFNRLDDTRGRGCSFDAGCFTNPADGLNLALSAGMLSWGFYWDTGEKDPVIPSLRGGLEYTTLKDHVNLLSDVEWTPRNYPQGHLGMEYWIIPQICVRGGAQGPNPVKGSGGFGLKYEYFSVDYAFVYHHSKLGHSHFLSIGIDIEPPF